VLKASQPRSKGKVGRYLFLLASDARAFVCSTESLVGLAWAKQEEESMMRMLLLCMLMVGAISDRLQILLPRACTGFAPGCRCDRWRVIRPGGGRVGRQPPHECEPTMMMLVVSVVVVMMRRRRRMMRRRR
jgi:hypothetical protein